MAKKKKAAKAAAALGEQALTQQLADQVSADAADSTVLSENPDLAAEAADIRGNLEGMRGKLSNLDPETRAALEAELTQNEAMLKRSRAEQSDNMLTRMFGSGRERSTYAADSAGRMLTDQELAMGNLRTGHQRNVLNTRLGMTENDLRNLGMQGDMLSSDRSAQAADRGLQFAQVDAQRSRRASMLDSAYNRRSGELNARTAADAQKASARMSMRGSMYASDNSLKAAMEHASASRYGSRMSAEASRYGADRGLDAARTNASASRANAMLAAETDRYGIDARTGLGYADLQQSGSQFDQSLGWQQEKFGIEDERARDFFGRDLSFREKELRSQQQIAQQQSRSQKRSSMLGALGSIAGTVGMGLMMSDAELKEEIEKIKDPLLKLAAINGSSWKWNNRSVFDGTESGGVIAQDVQKVIPEAVREGTNGYLMVDYNHIIGLLVEAVKQLAEERDLS